MPLSARLLSGRSGELLSSSQLRRVDAVDEQVGIEAGLGDEGEHAAGRGLDRHQRAAAVAERLLGDFLQPDVERERQVVAGGGRGARERAHAAAAGVDLDLLEAGDAVQLALVALLEAGLADVVGALVVRGQALVVLDALHVLVVDAADVADHVRGELAVRVLAEQARLDVDAGEAVAVGGEARDLLVGEAGADRQAVGALGFDHQALEALAVARAGCR